MTRDRILFFASGDFAIETFKTLIESEYNVVGLVTSFDKVKFHNYHIVDVAKEYNIPFYIIKNGIPMENDDFFMDWLKRVNADIFCVISFKKLPNDVIRLANKCSFNVHASLLPFLKGAAPINWAIRLGYKKTGLTAFVLNDRIDDGDIIANVNLNIYEGEKFTELFNRLSSLCVDFVPHVLDDVLQNENWKSNLIVQGDCSKNYELLYNATKINSDYFRCNWTHFTAIDFKHCVDSVNDVGFDAVIIVDDGNKEIKRIPIKIYDVEIGDDYDEHHIWQTQSDGKTYIKLNLSEQTTVYIKKLQMDGKKVMDVADFLNGFRYFREKQYTTYITDLMEAEK